MNATRIRLYDEKRPTKDKPNRVVWILRWRGMDGKRYGEFIGQVGKMTRREAQARQRAKQSGMDHGDIPRDAPRKVTLDQFRTLHRELARGNLRERTLDLYHTAFGHAIKALGCEQAIEAVTVAHVAKIKGSMLDGGLAYATVYKTMTQLRAAWNRGRAVGVVTSNPFAKLGMGQPEPKAAHIFTKAEIDTLVSLAPDLWLKALVKLAFTSGLRQGELFNLRWQDVDLDAGTVKVERRTAGTFAVDGVEYKILPWSAKAKASYRTVPIPSDTVALLRQLREEPHGSAYLFLSLDRLRAIQDRVVWRSRHRLVRTYLERFQALQRRAFGSDAKLGTLHDARKTFCTHAAAVVPMHVLKEIAGHADIGTTARFYTRTQQSDADAIRKVMEGKPSLRLAG